MGLYLVKFQQVYRLGKPAKNGGIISGPKRPARKGGWWMTGGIFGLNVFSRAGEKGT